MKAMGALPLAVIRSLAAKVPLSPIGVAGCRSICRPTRGGAAPPSASHSVIDDHLAGAAVIAADEDQRAVDEVAHVDRAARAGGARRRLIVDAAGLPRARHARDDLRPRVDLARAPADALAEALDGVIGDGDEDAQGSRS